MCVVPVGIGATGCVVVTGGTGSTLVADRLGVALVVAVGLGVAAPALTSPAVAVSAGRGGFALPLVATAAIADPPQHNSRNVPTMPRISGKRDLFAGAGIAFAGGQPGGEDTTASVAAHVRRVTGRTDQCVQLN